MPKPVIRIRKANAAAQAAVLLNILPELLGQLVKEPMTVAAVENASRTFKKALIERALGAEMYATDVTPDFISAATNAVLAEVTTWQKCFIINIAPQLHTQNSGQSRINRST